MHASEVQGDGVVDGEQLVLPLAHRAFVAARCDVAAVRLQAAQHRVGARHQLQKVPLAELDLHCSFNF
jgi:hypothetical protein